MKYIESIDYLNSFINFERLSDQQFNTREDDLKRFRQMLKELGDPHLQYPVIHVAGTKGKGSTAMILASILKASGLKVGLYTSPHLVTVRERIRINNRMLSKKQFATALRQVVKRLSSLENDSKPSFRTLFEYMTAMAFARFAKKRVDIAVIETGLGGKLDSTNVVEPILSIITPIGYDHMAILGETIEEIAADKAHIIKPKVPVVCSVQQYPDAVEQIKQRADSVGSQLTMATKSSDSIEEIESSLTEVLFRSKREWLAEFRDPFKMLMVGQFQLDNVATVITALEQLQKLGYEFSHETIRRGLRVARWGGRMEYFKGTPPVILDGAHNDLAMETLINSIRKLTEKPLRVVMSSMRSKPFSKMLDILSAHTVKFYLAPIQFPKSLAEEELVKAAEEANVDADIFENIPAAFEAARSEADDNELVLATGSLYLVGEILRHMKGDPAPHADGRIDSRV